MKQNQNRTRKDETGNIYGSWEVLELSEKYNKQQTLYWKCRCVCGTIKDVKGTSLRNNSSTCCGCSLKPLTLPQTPESIYKKYYRSYKFGCKRRTKTYSFEISYEFYRTLVEKPCYFCGREPYDIRYLYNRHRKNDIRKDVKVCMNGVDRLDNRLGYTETNCVPCCKMCNLMKLDSSEEDFISQVSMIYNNRRTK